MSEANGPKKRKMSLEKRHNLTGWAFLAPATIMIAIMSFWPMIQALILSFQTGKANNLEFGGLTNYIRMFKDKVFMTSLGNTFLYLIIQVPIMLVLALMLAQMLNNKDLRGKGIFRTAIFLPCATSLVSYAIIFRSLFGVDGFINSVLINLGILDKGYNFLGNAFSAKVVIIIALVWRWTGYNMVFYLAGLQNIEYSVYEAAKIDGASPMQTFFKITVPLLKPTIVMTAIMSTNGTLQLFEHDEDILSVSGYSYPLDWQAGENNVVKVNSYFSAWGYGTWKKKEEAMLEAINLDNFESQMRNPATMRRLYHSGKNQYCNFVKGMIGYTDMLFEDGEVISVDLSDALYQIFNGKYTIFPTISKVRNMGYGGDGVHCAVMEVKEGEAVNHRNYSYDQQPIDESLQFEKIIVKEVDETERLNRLMEEFFTVSTREIVASRIAQFICHIGGRGLLMKLLEKRRRKCEI